MIQNADVMTKPIAKLDYSLTGINSTVAVEMGLAEAEWYQSPVPRDDMRRLLERRDGPAIRNTFLWFGLIFCSGYATYRLWGSWWALLPYAIYSVLYASSSDSRWHEAGHGTAFKTDWLNTALYEVASFMVMRESTVWRWSHTRHHSDTIIVGRDPEISVPRPADIVAIVRKFFGLKGYEKYFKHVVIHSLARTSAEERTYIPTSEFTKLFTKARIYLAIYAVVIALSVERRSVLPLMFIGFTNLFGTWLMVVYGMTQHAGLAENVLDHRLNCRTVYMGPVQRFLYLNMNYHTEHHMYPLVPYHALPALHEAVKDDCPPPYPGLLAAWKEIFAAVLKQVNDPAFHIKRTLPPPRTVEKATSFATTCGPDEEGWVPACPSASLAPSDVVRFDYERKTFALYRDETDQLFATDGICTHGNVHLSNGLVKGGTIECPKHNGRFNLSDGSPARTPVCRGLATYPIQSRDGMLHINVLQPGGAGRREPTAYNFEVVSNDSVSTFIKELVLVPVAGSTKIAFIPGDYMQFEIPAYDEICFRSFDIPEPYANVWESQHIFDLVARNPLGQQRNNYSIASNSQTEKILRFNIRIATPPPGQMCAPGRGSSYMFSLRPGDIVTAIGPFGDFHIKPTQREMVYIGGGAGMAPLRAHLSHLFETGKTARKVSFWYGARSRQEFFYINFFDSLAKRNGNFTFQPALSAPLPQDDWDGHEGFIHDVVFRNHLSQHPNPQAAEYYLCGPPMMIKACIKMLTEAGVPPTQIAYDEF